MKKVFYSLLKSLVLTVTLSHSLPSHGQEETLRIPMTTEDAKSKYSTISMQRTSVHDPSIVYDEGSRLYYVFGSHMATAKTRDLQNWTGVSFPWGTVDTDGTITSNVAPADAFHTHQTRKITIHGETVDFGNFDAAAWNCALPGTDANGKEIPWTVDGNMWAPDIIYNPTLGKWCQYLSLNGPQCPAHRRPHRRALRLPGSCDIQRVPQRHGRAHLLPQNRLGISCREAIEPPRTV